MKGQKGITLVALIITIIVLLILAVVTIASVTGDNIIEKSKQAKEMYTQAAENENTKLTEWENIMNEIVTSEDNTFNGDNTLDGTDNTLDGTDNTLETEGNVVEDGTNLVAE